MCTFARLIFLSKVILSPAYTPTQLERKQEFQINICPETSSFQDTEFKPASISLQNNMRTGSDGSVASGHGAGSFSQCQDNSGQIIVLGACPVHCGYLVASLMSTHRCMKHLPLNCDNQTPLGLSKCPLGSTYPQLKTTSLEILKQCQNSRAWLCVHLFSFISATNVPLTFQPKAGMLSPAWNSLIHYGKSPPQ